MIRALDHLIQKYDAATVFVTAATIVVIIELSLMRLLVPGSSAAETVESGLLMDQVFNTESVAQTTSQLESWDGYSTQLVDRLSNETHQWQKDLTSMYAFGQKELVQETNHNAVDEKKEQMAFADYAANQLYLQ